MLHYAYSFNIEEVDSEVFFRFPKFPEIISAVDRSEFVRWRAEEKMTHGEDAVITALQSIISLRMDVPDPDDMRIISSDEFVRLDPLHAMKIELYRVYLKNCTSVSDFARRVGKQDTTARRLLNLRHRSSIDEVIDALAGFGIRLSHCWSTEQIAFSFNRSRISEMALQ